jgi:hypothetical protein
MHGWQIEALMQAIKHSLRIEEVPIRYTAGRSSFMARTVADVIRGML